tara:strand:- start:12639 stop:16955 length:4317 start_codon:yes stop_codon:yes gene_type:complete
MSKKNISIVVEQNARVVTQSDACKNMSEKEKHVVFQMLLKALINNKKTNWLEVFDMEKPTKDKPVSILFDDTKVNDLSDLLEPGGMEGLDIGSFSIKQGEKTVVFTDDNWYKAAKEAGYCQGLGTKTDSFGREVPDVPIAFDYGNLAKQQNAVLAKAKVQTLKKEVINIISSHLQDLSMGGENKNPSFRKSLVCDRLTSSQQSAMTDGLEAALAITGGQQLTSAAFKARSQKIIRTAAGATDMKSFSLLGTSLWNLTKRLAVMAPAAGLLGLGTQIALTRFTDVEQETSYAAGGWLASYLLIDHGFRPGPKTKATIGTAAVIGSILNLIQKSDDKSLPCAVERVIFGIALGAAGPFVTTLLASPRLQKILRDTPRTEADWAKATEEAMRILLKRVEAKVAEWPWEEILAPPKSISDSISGAPYEAEVQSILSDAFYECIKKPRNGGIDWVDPSNTYMLSDETLKTIKERFKLLENQFAEEPSKLPVGRPARVNILKDMSDEEIKKKFNEIYLSEINARVQKHVDELYRFVTTEKEKILKGLKKEFDESMDLRKVIGGKQVDFGQVENLVEPMLKSALKKAQTPYVKMWKESGEKLNQTVSNTPQLTVKYIESINSALRSEEGAIQIIGDQATKLANDIQFIISEGYSQGNSVAAIRERIQEAVKSSFSVDGKMMYFKAQNRARGKIKGYTKTADSEKNIKDLDPEALQKIIRMAQSISVKDLEDHYKKIVTLSRECRNILSQIDLVGLSVSRELGKSIKASRKKSLGPAGVAEEDMGTFTAEVYQATWKQSKQITDDIMKDLDAIDFVENASDMGLVQQTAAAVARTAGDMVYRGEEKALAGLAKSVSDLTRGIWRKILFSSSIGKRLFAVGAGIGYTTYAGIKLRHSRINNFLNIGSEEERKIKTFGLTLYFSLMMEKLAAAAEPGKMEIQPPKGQVSGRTISTSVRDFKNIVNVTSQEMSKKINDTIGAGPTILKTFSTEKEIETIRAIVLDAIEETSGDALFPETTKLLNPKKGQDFKVNQVINSIKNEATLYSDTFFPEKGTVEDDSFLGRFFEKHILDLGKRVEYAKGFENTPAGKQAKSGVSAGSYVEVAELELDTWPKGKSEKDAETREITKKYWAATGRKLTSKDIEAMYSDPKNDQHWSSAFITYVMQSDPGFQKLLKKGEAILGKGGATGRMHTHYYGSAMENSINLAKGDDSNFKRGEDWIYLPVSDEISASAFPGFEKQHKYLVGLGKINYTPKIGDIAMAPSEAKSGIHGDIVTSKGRIGGNVRGSKVDVRTKKTKIQAIVTKNPAAVDQFINKTRQTSQQRPVAGETGVEVPTREGVMQTVNKKYLQNLVKEVLNENSGQGYAPYPYGSSVRDEEQPEADYTEEWKSFSTELIRDSSRDIAIEVAKVLVKDLELFEDVLELAGQNQSVGQEILRKVQEAREKTV